MINQTITCAWQIGLHTCIRYVIRLCILGLVFQSSCKTSKASSILSSVSIQPHGPIGSDVLPRSCGGRSGLIHGPLHGCGRSLNVFIFSGRCGSSCSSGNNFSGKETSKLPFFFIHFSKMIPYKLQPYANSFFLIFKNFHSRLIKVVSIRPQPQCTRIPTTRHTALSIKRRLRRQQWTHTPLLRVFWRLR